MDKKAWMSVIEYGLQKGFNVTVGVIGLKFIFFNSDLSTDRGVLITMTGSVLISIAAIIEYLVWKQRLIYTTDQAELQLLKEAGPGTITDNATSAIKLKQNG